MLREGPAVAERVDDLPVPVAPERILQREGDLGPRLECALPEVIHVVGVDRERTDGASKSKR